MDPSLILVVVALGALIQIIVLICFFVLCSHMAKLLRAAIHIRDKQLPVISEQLGQICERLPESHAAPVE
jgi:hypothetical protein